MFVGDQRDVVLLRPVDTAHEDGLQERARDLDEVHEGLVGELDDIVAAVGRIFDGGDVHILRCGHRFADGFSALERGPAGSPSP